MVMPRPYDASCRRTSGRRRGMSAAYYRSRCTSTGRSALWTSPAETEPSMVDLIAPRPREPTTITAARSASAAAASGRQPASDDSTARAVASSPSSRASPAPASATSPASAANISSRSPAISAISSSGPDSSADPARVRRTGDRHACRTTAGRPESSRAAVRTAARAPSDPSKPISAGPEKSGSAGRHDQHGARRVMQQRRRRRAQVRAREAALAARAGHDDVGRPLRGRFADAAPRALGRLHDGGRLEAGLARDRRAALRDGRGLLAQRALVLLRRGRDDLVGQRHARHPRLPEHERGVADMHDVRLRPRQQPRGGADRAAGVVRAVVCDQRPDPLSHAAAR